MPWTTAPWPSARRAGGHEVLVADGLVVKRREGVSSQVVALARSVNHEQVQQLIGGDARPLDLLDQCPACALTARCAGAR